MVSSSYLYAINQINHNQKIKIMRQLIAFRSCTIKLVAGFMLGCIVVDGTIGFLVGPILIQIDLPEKKSPNEL